MPDEANTTTPNDEELVRATLGGEKAAFGQLVERHWNMVVALALSKIADAATAEDVAQESFVKAYSHLHSLREASRFAGWLSKIAIQQCSNVVRTSIRTRRALGVAATPLETVEAEAACEVNPGLSEEQVGFVRGTIQRLPEKFRKLIIMRFVGGLSAVDIAKQLGKRPGTVRVWLHRAYNILRKDLDPLLEEVGS